MWEGESSSLPGVAVKSPASSDRAAGGPFAAGNFLQVPSTLLSHPRSSSWSPDGAFLRDLLHLPPHHWLFLSPACSSLHGDGGLGTKSMDLVDRLGFGFTVEPCVIFEDVLKFSVL